MTKIAMFTGSFDPITNGHMDIIARASKLFDELYIGLFYNKNKQGFWDVETRKRILEEVMADLSNVKVITAHDSLAVDIARDLGVTYLVRGLRNATDFDYEANMDYFNKGLAPEIETVYLIASHEVTPVSSSRVRELIYFEGDISSYVPKAVVKEVEAKRGKQDSSTTGVPDKRLSHWRRHGLEEPFEHAIHTTVKTMNSRAIGKSVSNKYFFNGRVSCDDQEVLITGAFFRNQDLLVVGGGDSAVEEGIYLTRFANSVTIVHRRDELRAQKVLQDRAFANEKVKFIWDSVVEEIKGDDIKVRSVDIKNVKTGEVTNHEFGGVFVYVGLDPVSDYLTGLDITDQDGWVITDDKMATRIPGIFAIGDVRQKDLRQITTAVGDGATAGIEAYNYVTALGDK